MAGRQPWEYLVEREPGEQRLNELGADGWELVSVAEHRGQPTCYFKRPAADMRERVTLDHRQRFVAAAGGQSGAEE